VLSEAYNQIRKNAYRTSDDRGIEEATVSAIDAAQRALALDPDRSEIRRHLEGLTEQLAAIRARRKAARDPTPSP
jgi:hypothetical protein